MYSNDGRDNIERTCKLKVKEWWNVIWEGRKNDLVRHLVVAWVRWDKKKNGIYIEKSLGFTHMGFLQLGPFNNLKITYQLHIF